jgi:anaerobic selenocysteine-containing dehydrogenase
MPETRHSVCALDCPDACGLLIHVDDGRGSKLRGDPDHPVTRGFLCGKVAQYLDHEYSPGRLLYPQRRIGAKGEGRFARISWDEALDQVAEKLTGIAREWGAEAILPYSYAGTMGYLQGSGMDRRFFHRLGASRLERTICSSAGIAGLEKALGVRYATEPEQFAKSKLIIAWGANVLSTNVHLWPFIVEARRNGARFYVIDPQRNKTASLADRHFAIQPGTDSALALGMMHVMIGEGLYDREYVARYTEGFEDLARKAAEYPPERAAALTGLSSESIVELARDYATIKPAAIRSSYGIQRSERGGMATRLIALLPALSGSWTQEGGGLQMTTSGAFHLNRKALEMPELQQISLGREARKINMVELGQALNSSDGLPVKALVNYNSNPAAVAPNHNAVVRGLRREDLFTVVLEQVQNDTADYADILLPVTTFLEHTDLYFAYGHYYLQLARPALPAPAETLSNVEIFRALAKRMGFTEPCFDASEDDLMRALLNSDHPFLSGITLERLEREHFVRLNVSPEGTPFQPFANGGFGTPSGKCNFDAQSIAYEPPVESRRGDRALLAKYPLELISPKNHNSMNSTFGARPHVDAATGNVMLHPQDAAMRGLVTGDSVRVFNDRGACVMRAHVEDAIAPGVVSAPSVRWPKSAPDRVNINALTSERLTDIGRGPTFYSCLVQVEKNGD